MKFKFNYKEKDFELEVEKCANVFSKGLGLMFGLKKKPLLFVFRKSRRRAIHSFFCQPFIAIWFNNDEVIDAKLIRNWRTLIKPFFKFDKLLEIPSNNKAFSKLLFLTNN